MLFCPGAAFSSPQLLVLDEPTQGVDVNGQVALYDLIDQLRHGTELRGADGLPRPASGDGENDEVLCLNHHICCSARLKWCQCTPNLSLMFEFRGLNNLGIYRHHHNHRHNLQDESCAGEMDTHD